MIEGVLLGALIIAAIFYLFIAVVAAFAYLFPPVTPCSLPKETIVLCCMFWPIALVLICFVALLKGIRYVKGGPQ